MKTKLLCTNIPIFFACLLFSQIIFFSLSCNKKDNTLSSTSNDDNLIKTFTLTDNSNNSYETSLEFSKDTLYVHTDANANIQSIRAVYTFTGKSVYPQSGSEFNFTKPQKSVLLLMTEQ